MCIIFLCTDFFYTAFNIFVCDRASLSNIYFAVHILCREYNIKYGDGETHSLYTTLNMDTVGFSCSYKGSLYLIFVRVCICGFPELFSKYIHYM